MPEPRGAPQAPADRFDQPPLPPVSVVIPAYNYAKFLPETIRSVLAQTHSDFELIVVDDGSTDDTADVVAAFSDSRIRYLWQRNAGLPAARNTGIRNARHEFIGLVDADDLWWPQFLEKCLAQFALLPESFGLVACRHNVVDPDGKPVPKSYRSSSSRELFPKEILLRSRFGASSVVLKKKAVEAAGWFDETLTSSEDRDLWIRLGRHYRIWFLDEEISSVRLHPNSMSRNAARMDANARRVFAKAWRDRVVPRWKLWWWLRLHACQHHESAWMFHDQGLFTTAIGQEVISFAILPWIWNRREIYYPPLFRVRAVARFLLKALGIK